MTSQEVIMSIQAALSVCDRVLIQALEDHNRRLKEIKSLADSISDTDNYVMTVARASADFRENVRKILKELPVYDPAS